MLRAHVIRNHELNLASDRLGYLCSFGSKQLGNGC